jgi:hypothetical protein
VVQFHGQHKAANGDTLFVQGSYRWRNLGHDLSRGFSGVLGRHGRVSAGVEVECGKLFKAGADELIVFWS